MTKPSTDEIVAQLITMYEDRYGKLTEDKWQRFVDEASNRALALPMPMMTPMESLLSYNKGIIDRFLAQQASRFQDSARIRISSRIL